MTGVDSWSTTPLTNETVDGTVTWKEGQLPSTVNNSMRQMLTDLRERFNDLPWFQYGDGDQGSGHLATPCIYESATSFSVTGNGDHTAVYHYGRPVRAVGTLTGTIYGYIASSSYSAGTTKTTVNVTWFTGSGLTNETLVISIGLPSFSIPPTGGGFARIIQIAVTDPNGDNIATGDGQAYARINVLLNGFNLTAVAGQVSTVSSSGAVMVQVRNVTDAVDMLSTKLTIDANEHDSATAAIPAVIDTTKDDVATADELAIDIDVAGTGAKGLIVELTFTPAS